MKISIIYFKRILFILTLFVFSGQAFAQEPPSNFWDQVRFGGGIGLNAGNGFFAFNISPSAIYEVNEYFAVGPSLIYSYQSSNDFKTSLYGGSIIALANPIREVQLSAEIEQLRVNQSIDIPNIQDPEPFWNTALFVGGGYRMQNVTIGVRYNLLFKNDDGVYTDAWAPFVRVFF